MYVFAKEAFGRLAGLGGPTLADGRDWPTQDARCTVQGGRCRDTRDSNNIPDGYFTMDGRCPGAAYVKCVLPIGGSQTLVGTAPIPSRTRTGQPVVAANIQGGGILTNSRNVFARAADAVTAAITGNAPAAPAPSAPAPSPGGGWPAPTPPPAAVEASMLGGTNTWIIGGIAVAAAVGLAIYFGSKKKAALAANRRRNARQRNVSGRSLLGLGFTVLATHGNWFEVIDPSGDPGALLRQSVNRWHWFSKYDRATGSGRDPVRALRGGLGDAIDTDSQMRSYCRMVETAPRSINQDYAGVFAALCQCRQRNARRDELLRDAADRLTWHSSAPARGREEAAIERRHWSTMSVGSDTQIGDLYLKRVKRNEWFLRQPDGRVRWGDQHQIASDIAYYRAVGALPRSAAGSSWA